MIEPFEPTLTSTSLPVKFSSAVEYGADRTAAAGDCLGEEAVGQAALGDRRPRR